MEAFTPGVCSFMSFPLILTVLQLAGVNISIISKLKVNIHKQIHKQDPYCIHVAEVCSFRIFLCQLVCALQ